MNLKQWQKSQKVLLNYSKIKFLIKIDVSARPKLQLHSDIIIIDTTFFAFFFLLLILIDNTTTFLAFF